MKELVAIAIVMYLLLGKLETKQEDKILIDRLFNLSNLNTDLDRKAISELNSIYAADQYRADSIRHHLQTLNDVQIENYLQTFPLHLIYISTPTSSQALIAIQKDARAIFLAPRRFELQFYLNAFRVNPSVSSFFKNWYYSNPDFWMEVVSIDPRWICKCPGNIVTYEIGMIAAKNNSDLSYFIHNATLRRQIQAEIGFIFDE